MSINVGRPPVNPAYKVRKYHQRDITTKVFEAMWGTSQIAPNSRVNIIAASRIQIESKVARIEIYQVVNNQKFDVAAIDVPLVNGKINYTWLAEPKKTGNFEEGVYHFEISAGIYWGETQKPLVIRDLNAKRNASFFEAPKVTPKVVF